MSEDFNKRRGRIVVDYRFLIEHPERVQELFARIGFLPIRVDHDMFGDGVNYFGVARDFRVVEPGLEAPDYTVVCEAGENGELKSVTVKEVEK